MSEQDRLVERINADIQKTMQSILPAMNIPNCMEAIHQINNMDKPIEKQLVVKELDTLDPIVLIPLGDQHLGSTSCNIEMIKRIVHVILSTPNCYTVLLGDLAESCTKDSVGMAVFEEDFNLPEQLKVLYMLLKPLAEQGKILGAVIGNHEQRILMKTKLDPIAMLCDKLNVPYLGYQGYILLKTRKTNYKIYIHHGTGGGSTPGAKRNAMRSPSKVADVDLYLTGHTHDRFFDSDVTYIIDEFTEKIIRKKRYYVVCGSSMEYFGGYPEMKALPPSDSGAVMLILDATRKDIRAMM